MKIEWKRMIALSLALLLLSGCSAAAPSGAADDSLQETAGQLADLPEELEDVYLDQAALDMDLVEIEDETVALAASVPAAPVYLTVSAPGTKKASNNKAVIDYSNAADGYVMVQYTASTTQRLKALVTGPTTQYQYNITPGKWVSVPLSDGNGTYQVAIYENVKGTSYSNVIAEKISVTLKDEFSPFLHSNQYVDFEAAPKTIAKADELCKGITDPLKKVEAVYTFVIKNLTYDKNKAATVQSGYLPVLDTVLDTKTGICFDYAALMTGMLRSQGVPCKLVIGYAGTAYHAWISVWSKDTGWVEGVVYFDGTTWQRMDPTFASTGGQNSAIMQYIGDGKNYSAKYFY